jgi:hypothetical protein
MNRQETAIGDGSRWLDGLGGPGRAEPRIIARSRDGNSPLPDVRVGQNRHVEHRPGASAVPSIAEAFDAPLHGGEIHAALKGSPAVERYSSISVDQRARFRFRLRRDRDCGISVFECLRHHSDHEKHGEKYLGVVCRDRCDLQEVERAFVAIDAPCFGYRG